MTDLRDLDRQAAELHGSDYVIPSKWSPAVFTQTNPAHFSSDPAAANLLIEDLRKRQVLWTMTVDCAGNACIEAYPNERFMQSEGGTWMEAVTRFYIAIMEAQE